MRAFVALPLPEAALGPLLRIQAEIPFGRAVPEENLHLTLAFLGDVETAALEELDAMLSDLRFPVPDLIFQGLETLDAARQGLICVTVAASDPLKALQARVAQVARGAGVELPRRRFRPHVTLTRGGAFRGVSDVKLAASLGQAVHVPPARAERMALYRSDLRPDGALHTILAEYPLG